MGEKNYQVWHDRGWPQSRIEQILGTRPAPTFPSGFTHVADVKANGLREAVEKTSDRGGLLDDSRPWAPWERNEGVQAHVDAPRDTVPGDVVVDPDGRPFRVEAKWFKEAAPERDGPDLDME